VAQQPKTRTATRRYRAGRPTGNECGILVSPQLHDEQNGAECIGALKLESALRRIKADWSACLWRPRSGEAINTSAFAHWRLPGCLSRQLRLLCTVET